MTATSDLDALLAAILADPACDTARLVYADELQARGQEERAEFIRVQVEIARLMVLRGDQELPRDLLRLRLEEAKLLRNWWGEWCPQCRPDNSFTFEMHLSYLVVVSRERETHARLFFSRGFLSELTCPAADWLTHGDAIRAAHPVTKVRLTTHVLSSARTDNVPMPITWYLKRWPGIDFELPA